MIKWNFKIDGELVDEPRGWSDITLQVTRDPDWQGIFFEASTSTLGFYGRGADILMAKKSSKGLAATAVLTIEAVCGEEIDILEGSLNFGVYEEQCGNTCIVNIGVEKIGCTMTLRNRFDQKVDLSSVMAFDKATVLTEYPGLNFEMDIVAQEIMIGDEQHSTEDDSANFADQIYWTGRPIGEYFMVFAPPMPQVTNNSFGTFLDSPFADLMAVGPDSPPQGNTTFTPFPTSIGTATLLGDIECALDDVTLEYRLKGSAQIIGAGGSRFLMRVRLYRLPSGADPLAFPTNNWIIEHNQDFYDYTTAGSRSFDISATVVIPSVVQGDFFWWGVDIYNATTDDWDNVIFNTDKESFFKMSASSVCETTEAVASLVNETGSRIIESVTDGCLRMKSDYYGRTDSQPYASDEDGCGSLRVLTSGLRLRNAKNPVHFMSPSDYFKGLRGIDNIGMGIEQDQEFPTREWVRVEPVEYFYDKTKEMLRIEAVPFIRFLMDPSKGYSIIKIGYTKWEVENVNGLDEFNSNKEFRTSLETLSNPLDALSPFVAGGYAIEITRQQSFAESGGADTTYDNETFIICVEREAYGYHVEQGNILDAADIYSPETAYNWRIRPFYNLMRWWKSIAQSYVSLYDSASKLFFSAGTGNLLASGRLPDGDPCDLAAGAYPENDNLDIFHFKIENLPIFQPERAVFSYPMSLREYLLVKASPYGYISVQCGNGTFVKGFILDIQYRPADGLADFNLQLSWDTA